MNASTLKRLCFQKDCSLLQAYALSNGINYLITAYHRTAPEQHVLYLAGKSRCDGYKLKSAHQSWLAVDIVMVNPDGSLNWQRDDRYEKLGAYWRDIRGNAWGGDWEKLNDIYHFELKDSGR